MASTTHNSARVYPPGDRGGEEKKNGNRFMVAIFKANTE
jgi:hypothetical protein